MKRTCFLFLALALFVVVYGSAVLGCGGGSSSIGTPAPDPSIAAQKGVIHYIGDHLGNTHLITDSKGNVLREESRYPYGLDWRVDGADSTTADYVYTGKEYDGETGLVYFGGRYYSPEMGRWITPDPLFLEKPSVVSERPSENNLYSFTRGNPVVFVDTDGLGSWAVTGGPFDISSGVPQSWYPYGGNLLDIPYNVVNVGANALGYATYGAERVLNYAGTNLNEVGLYFMEFPAAGASLSFASAWANARMAEYAAGGVAAQAGKIKLGLGLCDPKRGLDYSKWAWEHGYQTYSELSGRGSFSNQLRQAAHLADEIGFNIEGVDVRQANNFLNEFGEPMAGYTNYELQTIKEGYMEKTRWWFGDRQMSEGFNPFE